MTIVLHIGLPKTGSSTIQHLLDTHRAELARLGLHYPDGGKTGRSGTGITAGNGADLSRYLNPRQRPKDFSQDGFEAAFRARWLTPDRPRCLISSELLAFAQAELLERFRDRLTGGRPVRIVAFVRDLYGHAWSAWMQMIKRHACTEDFATYCETSYNNPQFQAIKRYAGVFPGAVSLLHYETEKRDVFGAFAKMLDIDLPATRQRILINRSLCKAETEVLIECNRRHGNPMISTFLSDTLLERHPDRPKWEGWHPEIAERLAARFTRQVNRLNRDYFGGAPTLAVARPPEPSQGEAGPAAEEVWADVDRALAEWRRQVAARTGGS